MSDRTAVLSQGTNRGSWMLWMVGAFLFAGAALAVAMLAYSLVRSVIPLHLTAGLDLALVVAATVICTALVLAGVRFARRRLAVPPEVWLAMAAFAAVIWVVNIPQAGGGFYAPLRAPVVITLGLLAAWLLDRRALRS